LFISKFNKVGTPCFFFIFLFLMLQNVNELPIKNQHPFLNPNADRHVFFQPNLPSNQPLSVASSSYGAAKVITFFVLPKLFSKF